jgi:hypothetical protein
MHQVTATLSVELDGAPAAFQIRVDDDGLMRPRAVRFAPAGPHDSFAFTFVQNVGPFEANDHHSLTSGAHRPQERRRWSAGRSICGTSAARTAVRQGRACVAQSAQSPDPRLRDAAQIRRWPLVRCLSDLATCGAHRPRGPR